MRNDLGDKGKRKMVRRKKPAAKPEETVKPRSIRPSTLVEKAIRGIANRIEADDMKATVGDLIRLLQLKQELDTEEPREIKVRWVEPDQSPAPKK